MVIRTYSRCVRGKIHSHMRGRGQGSLFLHLIVAHGQGRSAIGAIGGGEVSTHTYTLNCPSLLTLPLFTNHKFPKRQLILYSHLVGGVD